jgi:ATP adenylyltransferase
LKAAGGSCQLCGISAKERPIDVNHIVPRSRGGKSELANLQALCSKCNAQNEIRTNQILDHGQFLPPLLRVCFWPPDLVSKAIERNGSVFAIHDRHPVTPAVS